MLLVAHMRFDVLEADERRLLELKATNMTANATLVEQVMHEISVVSTGGLKSGPSRGSGPKSYPPDASDDDSPVSSLFFDEDEGADTASQRGAAANKQLYWYDLKNWSPHREKNEPLFQKKPMHGDKDYQRQYHQSFFHPDKDRLLGIPGYSLVDKFNNKEGAFAIPGVQRRLNFLMHGPPGTGKSKFVRTLAMYLQRHVVSFSLTQIETEGQLMTILDDLKSITDDPRKLATELGYEVPPPSPNPSAMTLS